MFGPGVHIHGGNHDYSTLGLYMKDNHSKELGSDGKVIVGDDCWIGSGAYILKGVTIGKGSVIGACSVITKDIPPYSVVVGGLPRKEFNRFSQEELPNHLSLLKDRYPDA